TLEDHPAARLDGGRVLGESPRPSLPRGADPGVVWSQLLRRLPRTHREFEVAFEKRHLRLGEKKKRVAIGVSLVRLLDATKDRPRLGRPATPEDNAGERRGREEIGSVDLDRAAKKLLTLALAPPFQQGHGEAVKR